ncbi:MAG: hypothetical protein HC869_00910 [Rhodospirillales bacterium]|nr:hypothetical protein [Rhodospirillales bacterium]
MVTEPGTTPLLARQLLSEEELRQAEDRYGPATFTARSLGDILDDWLTAPIAEQAPANPLARLMVLDMLLGTNASAERVVAAASGAAVADLCWQTFAHMGRLGRLKDAGAPEIVRRTERRMLRATARALFRTAALTAGPD